MKPMSAWLFTIFRIVFGSPREPLAAIERASAYSRRRRFAAKARKPAICRGE